MGIKVLRKKYVVDDSKCRFIQMYSSYCMFTGNVLQSQASMSNVFQVVRLSVASSAGTGTAEVQTVNVSGTGTYRLNIFKTHTGKKVSTHATLVLLTIWSLQKMRQLLHVDGAKGIYIYIYKYIYIYIYIYI